MANTEFDKRIKNIYNREGYYANLKNDKGGETYRGIARKFHPNWEGWNRIEQEKAMRGVKELPNNYRIDDKALDDSVYNFYKTEFWEKPGINKLTNPSIQDMVLDFGVNSQYGAARELKKLLNKRNSLNLGEKLSWTPELIDALNEYSSPELFEDIRTRRKGYYDRIVAADKTQQAHYKGWMNRLAKFKYATPEEKQKIEQKVTAMKQELETTANAQYEKDSSFADILQAATGKDISNVTSSDLKGILGGLGYSAKKARSVLRGFNRYQKQKEKGLNFDFGEAGSYGIKESDGSTKSGSGRRKGRTTDASGFAEALGIGKHMGSFAGALTNWQNEDKKQFDAAQEAARLEREKLAADEAAKNEEDFKIRQQIKDAETVIKEKDNEVVNNFAPFRPPVTPEEDVPFWRKGLTLDPNSKANSPTGGNPYNWSGLAGYVGGLAAPIAGMYGAKKMWNTYKDYRKAFNPENHANLFTDILTNKGDKTAGMVGNKSKWSPKPQVINQNEKKSIEKGFDFLANQSKIGEGVFSVGEKATAPLALPQTTLSKLNSNNRLALPDGSKGNKVFTLTEKSSPLKQLPEGGFRNAVSERRIRGLSDKEIKSIDHLEGQLTRKLNTLRKQAKTDKNAAQKLKYYEDVAKQMLEEARLSSSPKSYIKKFANFVNKSLEEGGKLTSTYSPGETKFSTIAPFIGRLKYQNQKDNYGEEGGLTEAPWGEIANRF